MTRHLRASAVLLLLAGLSARPLSAEPEKIKFQHGPGNADLGSNIAQIHYGDGYVFADAAETRRLMTAMGNHANDSEVGFIAPSAKGQDWFVVFEWEQTGYVKDDDKNAIDADKLLASIREGTEESNKRRRENGTPTLTVTGWDEKPHYDERSHNLVWSILAMDSKGDRVVNYNVRLLGREGVMSATLVADPSTLSTIKPELATLIQGFTYKQGKRYAEWKSGDKIAKYGLAALVTGGAGIAAVKLGLLAGLWKILAKGWKLVVVGFAALGAAIKRAWKALFGREERPGVNPG